MTAHDPDDDDDGGDFDLDVVGILRRRYPLILLGVFIGSALACLYYVQQIPIYQSSFKVLVGMRSGDLNASGGAGKLLEGASTIEETILSTHIELIRSPRVINKAISDSRLSVDAYTVSENLSLARGGGTTESQNANLLIASYTDPDAQRAAKVLQAIYDAYQSYITTQSTNIGDEAAELIAKTQVENERILREADREYREFISSLPAMVNISQSGDGALQDLHQVRLAAAENELASVRTTLAKARSRREVIRKFVAGRKPDEISELEVLALLSPDEIGRFNAAGSSLAQMSFEEQAAIDRNRTIAQRTDQLESGRILDQTSQLNLLRATYGDNHPTVAVLKNDLASLKRYLASAKSELPELPEMLDNQAVKPVEMLRSYYAVLNSDIEEHEKRERQLVEISDEEANASKEIQMAFMNGNSLKANLDRAQRRYDEVFQRLQEINLANDYAGFSTDLLVSPQPAGLPVSPVRSKIAAMGVIAGAMLGFGFAALAELADRTFHNPDEVEQVVGASILAHVPRLDAKAIRKRSQAAADSKISPLIVSHHLPRGNDSETFRVLRTSILMMLKRDDKKVLLATSPSPADGKSTTISNLAVSIAQTGKRVLLIDADMRRPVLHDIFGLDRSPGLADCVAGSDPWEACLRSTEQSSLTVCPCGSRTSIPSELLESPGFDALIRRAREQFDVVLIDAPPLLAVADPAIILAKSDGCLLTVRIEKNNRSLVQRATEIIREQGTPIEGVIVNGRDRQSGGYGYASYNYYGKKEYGYQAAYRRYYAADDGQTAPVKTKRGRRRSTETSSAGRVISALPPLERAEPPAGPGAHDAPSDGATPSDSVATMSRSGHAHQTNSPGDSV